MDSKDFFGAPDPEGALAAPSILAIVTDQCVSDFASNYTARKDGNFEVGSDGITDQVITEGDVTSDVRSWVKALSGSDVLGGKAVSLVRGNPGWEMIIAKRVIRELRRWATA